MEQIRRCKISIKTIGDLKGFVREGDGHWIFRGQSAQYPNLETTLERQLEKIKQHANIGMDKAQDIEKEMIRELERCSEIHKITIPPNQSTMYCLSLLRHYGAPSRLMDWTYSIYVAAYNSLNELDGKGGLIFAVNTDWMASRVKESIDPILIDKFGERMENEWFNEIFRKSGKSFVYVANSYLQNERQRIQQGLFLCPGNCSKTFMENLREMKGWNDKNNVSLVRIENKYALSILDQLRAVNISHATLFPGLEGFARSLGTRLHFFGKLASRRVR